MVMEAHVQKEKKSVLLHAPYAHYGRMLSSQETGNGALKSIGIALPTLGIASLRLHSVITMSLENRLTIFDALNHDRRNSEPRYLSSVALTVVHSSLRFLNVHGFLSNRRQKGATEMNCQASTKADDSDLTFHRRWYH